MTMGRNGEGRAREGPGLNGFATPDGTTLDDITHAKGTGVAAMVARGSDHNPAGQLGAWLAAVEHLHAAGLPAAVPEFQAAWLRRRGVRPDWVAAA